MHIKDCVSETRFKFPQLRWLAQPFGQLSDLSLTELRFIREYWIESGKAVPSQQAPVPTLILVDMYMQVIGSVGPGMVCFPDMEGVGRHYNALLDPALLCRTLLTPEVVNLI